MPGEDLSSAAASEPPLAPLPALSAARLTEIGTRIARRTWAGGLHRWFWGEGVALAGLAAFGLAAGSGDDGLVRDWFTRFLRPDPEIGTILQLIPFGYSVIRSDRPQPWGQGLALAAIAAALSATPER
jgi:hypothetical protein